ncbi:MAG: four helix bundle protein [Bacteroidetes bacterium]|nr:four helix bundle protein [Bacteroidota bacterium]
MGKIERFEDLKCWQAARELVKFTFIICAKGKLAKDFDTQRQLKKASLSSMNNISEGFARYHKKDSIHFYDISSRVLGTAEVKSMSYMLEDTEYLEPDDIKELREKTEKTRNLTLGLIRYVDNKK